MSARRITIAVAGNPNAGKTTLFNAITSSHQHVGNYAGVTVEKVVGTAWHRGVELHMVDLPGIYSLTPYSTEEIVARNFIMDERPDVVIDVVDCSNLQRNLYLATQLLELGVPVVLAFNMYDLAGERGCQIDVAAMEVLLGVPIIPTVGTKGQGLTTLLESAIHAAAEPRRAVFNQRSTDYGAEIEPHVRQLADRIAFGCGDAAHARWFAVKLLENDHVTADRLARSFPAQSTALLAEAARLRQHIESVCGDSSEIVLTDRRYGFIAGACRECVRQRPPQRQDYSDRIDKVLLNRFLGLPIFAAMMYLMFQLTFSLGGPLVGLLDHGKEWLGDAVRAAWPADHYTLLRSLVADGIIEGVGAVLAFVPLILLLYLAIAILEDSGYMARGAFVLDRLMHRFGLHGKSFIPMVIGFGCTVPALMATRILETRRDRLTTMLVLPLMSCGARLPVYVLILGAFFPSRVVLGLVPTGTAADGSTMYLVSMTNQAVILFAIYALGIVLAVLCARLLRRSLFKGEATPFVMELPPYRMPALRGLAVHMWERAWMYVKKAGTIILLIVVILWALKTWPALPAERLREFDDQRAALAAQSLSPDAVAAATQQIDIAQHRQELLHSAIGRIGQTVAPLLRPCGFDWKISTALLGSLAAKEAFIGQMGVIYAVPEHDGGGEQTLSQRLSADYRPLQGLCMMIFILISSPCAATLAMIAREAGSWKWAALLWTYLTVLAWTLATALYQTGRLVGF